LRRLNNRYARHPKEAVRLLYGEGTKVVSYATKLQFVESAAAAAQAAGQADVLRSDIGST
jgi:hypothetical protein